MPHPHRIVHRIENGEDRADKTINITCGYPSYAVLKLALETVGVGRVYIDEATSQRPQSGGLSSRIVIEKVYERKGEDGPDLSWEVLHSIDVEPLSAGQ